MPPRIPRRWASSRWKSVWKASSARMSARPRTGAAFMTFAPVRRATSAQKAGPSSPCSWTIVSPRPSTSPATSSSVRVDEHAADVGAPAQRGGDARRLGGVAGARRAGPQDAADRPGAGVDRQLRVVERGDAAELDAGGVRGHAPDRRLRAGWATVFGRSASVTSTVLPCRRAHQRDLDLVARLVVRDGRLQIVARADVLAVDLDDDVAAELDRVVVERRAEVAGADARLVGRAAGRDATAPARRAGRAG